MRKRILLVMGGTLLAMLAIIWFATRTILLSASDRMERTRMEENVGRVRAALEWDLDSMARTADDWGAWDETYEFLGDLDPAYADANLTDATLENLGLDLMAFLDTEGRLLYMASPGDEPAGIDATLASYPDLAHPPADTLGAEDIASVLGEPWLLASHRILRNDEEGPTRGTLLLGRRLDEAEVAGLSSRVRLTVRIVIPQELGIDDPAVASLAALTPSHDMVLERPAVDRLRAYVMLREGEDAPSIAAIIETGSEIRMQAIRSSWGFVLAIVASGAVFGAAMLIVLQRRVLSRLHSLGAQVLAIKTADQPSQRLEIEGTDQIAYLAAAINGMLAAIESSTAEIRAGERRTQAFLDVVPDAILLVSPEGTVRDVRLPPDWNLPGLTEQLSGRRIQDPDFLLPFISPAEKERLAAAIALARRTQTPQVVEVDAESAGSVRRLEVRIVGAAGDEMVFVGRDVTGRRQAEEAERNEILLREIHHRVRNNLQLISSLLSLQAGSTDEPKARALLEESQDRIRSMALVHERLTQSSRAGEFGFSAYIRDLVEHLGRSYAGVAAAVRISTDIEELPLPADASLPVGLITSELLTNALRHAFPGGRSGHVRVTLHAAPGHTMVLGVEDDGAGLPADLDPEAAGSLGFRIVSSLVRQLRARLEVERSGGTAFRLILPAP